MLMSVERSRLSVSSTTPERCYPREREAVFSQTETCLVLSLVNGSRFQLLQRSRKVIPDASSTGPRYRHTSSAMEARAVAAIEERLALARAAAGRLLRPSSSCIVPRLADRSTATTSPACTREGGE
jgi:hypothetical protein